MPADAAQLVRRWQRSVERRATVDQTNQNIADYIFPRKAWITRTAVEGTRQTDFQLDSTAERAAIHLAGQLLSTQFSPSQKWFSLKTRDEELNQIAEVDEWLEACADRLYLALNQANFTPEVGEFCLDLVIFGTAAMLIEERTPTRGQPGFGGFVFRTHQPGTYTIEEDATGAVDTFMRTFEVSHRVAKDIWGKAIGEQALETCETRPDAPLEVLHAIYPRTSAEYGKRSAQNMPWASCYVLPKPSLVLRESGYQEFPGAVARWAKASGEIYGRGPGHTAYPDVRSLNRLMELTLRAGEVAVDPTLNQLEDGVVGEVSLRPADINIITRQDAITPLDRGQNFTIADKLIQDLKASIRETFFHDQLVIPDSPQKTATEMQIRWELMLRALGATAGRIQSEAATPIITRCFSLAERGGMFPPVPEILLQYGAEIDVQYEGPLSRAQRSQDATAIQLWMQDLILMAQAGRPEVLDVANVDWLARHDAEVRGVPAQGVADDRAVSQVRQVRQEQAAKMQQAQLIAGAAEAAGKAAPMLKALQGGGNGAAPVEQAAA